MAKDSRVRGKVKWFSAQKGYGFIRLDNDQEVFVHHTSIIADGFRSLEQGDEVSFIMEEAKQPGKFQAVDVRVE